MGTGINILSGTYSLCRLGCWSSSFYWLKIISGYLSVLLDSTQLFQHQKWTIDTGISLNLEKKTMSIRNSKIGSGKIDRTIIHTSYMQSPLAWDCIFQHGHQRRKKKKKKTKEIEQRKLIHIRQRTESSLTTSMHPGLMTINLGCSRGLPLDWRFLHHHYQP